MGKLLDWLNKEKLEENYSLLVPAIFTERQFELLDKKIQQRKLKPVEQVYFSHSIAKKIRAINSLTDLEKEYFIYGEREIIKERKEAAIKLLKKIERNHKKMKILISGSFLYYKKYRDIDIFIISEYEKEDYVRDKLHFNYLKPEVLESVFFSSLSKICVANFDLSFLKIKEKISISQIISKYQEIMKDISEKNYPWLKINLRDFILDCSYLSEGVILDSFQLKNRLEKILKKKNKTRLIEKMFVYAILNGFEAGEIKTISLKMIKSYRELIKSYKHKEYYSFLINSFKEVLNSAG